MKYRCRIITDDFDISTRDEIVKVFCEVLENIGAVNIEFSDIAPYWKIEPYGEFDILFEIGEDKFTVLTDKLADNWSDDVTDKRYSNIFLPKVNFLWLSEF